MFLTDGVVKVCQEKLGDIKNLKKVFIKRESILSIFNGKYEMRPTKSSLDNGS